MRSLRWTSHLSAITFVCVYIFILATLIVDLKAVKRRKKKMPENILKFVGINKHTLPCDSDLSRSIWEWYRYSQAQLSPSWEPFPSLMIIIWAQENYWHTTPSVSLSTSLTVSTKFYSELILFYKIKSTHKTCLFLNVTAHYAFYNWNIHLIKVLLTFCVAFLYI